MSDARFVITGPLDSGNNFDGFHVTVAVGAFLFSISVGW
jgi:hypothetical protein